MPLTWKQAQVIIDCDKWQPINKQSKPGYSDMAEGNCHLTNEVDPWAAVAQEEDRVIPHNKGLVVQSLSPPVHMLEQNTEAQLLLMSSTASCTSVCVCVCVCVYGWHFVKYLSYLSKCKQAFYGVSSVSLHFHFNGHLFSLQQGNKAQFTLTAISFIQQ